MAEEKKPRKPRLEQLGPGKWRGRFTWTVAKKRQETQRVFTVEAVGGPAEKKLAKVAYDAKRAELKGAVDEWTVAETVSAWLPALVQGTERTRRTHAKSFEKLFGPLKLSRVPPPKIQFWLSNLSCGDYTAGLYRASILAMYKWAHEGGRLHGDNPMEKTVNRKRKETSAQARARCKAERDKPGKALMGEDRRRFFEWLLEHEPEIYPIMRVQYIIGGRVGEVAALQLVDVDWDTGEIDIWTNALRKGEFGPPKNGSARTATISSAALAFLRGHRARMEQLKWPGWETWLFPRPPFSSSGNRRGLAPRYNEAGELVVTWPTDTLGSKVKAALDALGILRDRVATHAMRHTHVTVNEEKRAEALDREISGERDDLRELQDRVGHKSLRMTERYTDKAVKKTRAKTAAERLEQSGAFADVVPLWPKGGVKGGVTIAETPIKQGRE